MMHGYEEFPQDVKRALKEIMINYNLEVIEESFNKVVFKSDRCILSISTEYDYVELHFKRNETDRWSFLGPFLEALYPGENIKINYPSEEIKRIDKIRFSLEEKVKLIAKYCRPILMGDFSWKIKYMD
jgi:hypothetical protein